MNIRDMKYTTQKISTFSLLTELERNAIRCMASIGADFFRKRIKMGMSQAQFAALLGIHKKTVNDIENADYNFTIYALCDMAQSAGMDVRIELIERAQGGSKND